MGHHQFPFSLRHAGQFPAPRRQLRSIWPHPATFTLLVLALLCMVPATRAQSATVTTLTETTSTSRGVPIPTGTIFTLTASVTAGGVPVTHGQVHFCDTSQPPCTDILIVGVAQLTGNGTATTKFIPGPGTHSFKAVFAGTNTNAPSSSTASTPLTVGLWDPTAIDWGGGPGDYTLAATVQGVGTTFPTGTVSFIDTSNANYVLATVPLTPEPALIGGVGADDTVYVTSTLYGGCGVNQGCQTGIAAADFNGDGKLDLAIGNSAVTFLLGNGDLTFNAENYDPFPGPWVTSIVAGDFNEDGKADIAVTQVFADGDFSSVYTYILLNNGDGTFNQTQIITGTGSPNLATGDFNGDGIPDLVLSAGGTEALGVTIMLGNGDGTFTNKSSYATGGTGPATIGDFNGDGKTDIAVPNAKGVLTVLLGNGDGTFTPSALPPPTPTTVLGYSPVIANFDGSGLLEEAVVGATANATEIIAGIDYEYPVVPVAVTSIPGILIIGTGTHQIAAVYNGNTVYLPSTSSTIPLTAEPEPTTLTLTANPTTLNQFQPVTLTATLTPDLAQNHNATGTVTFLSGTAIVGTASITAGVATLTTTTLPAGADSITASYAGDTNFAPSTSNTVTVAVTLVDFTMTLASPAITLESQHHLTTIITLASINNFTDSIAIVCGKLPEYVTCQPTPTPAALAADGTTSVSLYLDTDKVLGFAKNTAPPPPMHPFKIPAGLALSFLASLTALGKRRSRLSLLLLATLAISTPLTLTGCGEIILPPSSTNPGTYIIPITGTGAVTGVTHTVNLTLTVTR